MTHEEQEKSESDGTLTGLDRLVARGGRALSLLFLVSAAIIVYEVLARYLFGSPTSWAHETTIFICAICFAFGGCQCLARDKHIRIVVFYQKADPAAKRILDILISIIVLALCCLLSYAAWTMVQSSFFDPKGNFRMETSGTNWDPVFPALIKLALFLALLLMTIQTICQLIYHIRRKTDV